MAEPKDPSRTAPTGPPGSPLPRLWKAGPVERDGADVTKPTGKKKSKSSAKAGAKGADAAEEEGGTKRGVLREVTPELDTHETRQRIRIIVGACVLLVMSLGGFLITRQFAHEPQPDEQAAAPPAPAAGANQRETAEREAHVMLDRARDLAKNGKTNLALSLLEKVKSAYPDTSSAKEAALAIGRPAQNLPLFLDGPAVLASVSESSASASAEKNASEAAAPPAETVVPPPPGAVDPVRPPAVAAAPEKPVRPLPPGFHRQEASNVHESGWPLSIVCAADGAVLVLVPGGTFVQGRDDGDASEAPAHRVNMATFYIDQHEVTERQFDVFQKSLGRRAERDRAVAKEAALENVSDDSPAVMVTARDAADYAAWAGKRLPTEAQWEAAARTPDGRIHPWGPMPPAWAQPRSPRQIDPVMSFPEDVSPYGAFDLAGNAWEWTKDWYDARYYQTLRTTQADNPTGPSSRPPSRQLVVKGSAKDWSVSKREGLKFETRLPYLGFRCVLTVEGPGNVFEPPPPGQPNAPGQPPGAPTVPF